MSTESDTAPPATHNFPESAGPQPAEGSKLEAGGERATPSDQRGSQALVPLIVTLILAWTYTYNLLVKEQGPVEAFFKIIDTISDDFVIGSLLTIAVGVGIVIVFSLTKLYSQVMANVYSFRLLEQLIERHLLRGELRTFAAKMLNFRDQPQPEDFCPTRVWSVLLFSAVIYLVSWLYIVLFSEALFFVSWSAGVNLPINEHNMILMPTLALGIPFSARVMAYLRYPYAQDYADFMPGAVFVLLVVASLGFIFQSDDQQFYLQRVFSNPTFRTGFLKNGLFLAFIPLFFESSCWIFKMTKNSA